LVKDTETRNDSAAAALDPESATVHRLVPPN
jgi:hypothetical protein